MAVLAKIRQRSALLIGAIAIALFAFIILAGVSAREVFRARTTDQAYGDDKSKFQEWLDADEDTNDQNYDDN